MTQENKQFTRFKSIIVLLWNDYLTIECTQNSLQYKYKKLNRIFFFYHCDITCK